MKLYLTQNEENYIKMNWFTKKTTTKDYQINYFSNRLRGFICIGTILWGHSAQSEYAYLLTYLSQSIYLFKENDRTDLFEKMIEIPIYYLLPTYYVNSSLEISNTLNNSINWY